MTDARSIIAERTPAGWRRALVTEAAGVAAARGTSSRSAAGMNSS